MPKQDCPLEYDEQCAVVDWLEARKIKFSAIPNSTWTTSKKQKMRNYRSGLRRGMPDLLILLPCGVLFIEMKRAIKSKSSLKPEQKEWIDAINKTPGAEAHVCYGASEAIAIIERFITTSVIDRR